MKNERKKKGRFIMENKYQLGECFLTAMELSFKGEAVPKHSMVKIIETGVDGNEYKVHFMGCKHSLESIQTVEEREIDELALSDREAISYFINRLEASKTPTQVKELGDDVSMYVRKKSGETKALACDYWKHSLDKYDVFEAMKIKEKVQLFQQKEHLWEITKNEFVQMLEYCKIRVPKSCQYLTLIRNNETMKVETKNRAMIKTIYSAYDKLMSAEL